MAAAEISEMIRRFTAQYAALLDVVKADIMKALPYMTKWNAQRIITQILVKRHVRQSIIDDFMKNLMQVVAVSAEMPVDSVLVQDALLSPAWTVDGALFSSRVNDLSRLDELFTTIRRGLNLGESMRDIATDIFNTGIQKGDVTALVDKLAETSGLIAKNAGDIDLYRSLMQDVRKTQSAINRLVDPDTSTLRRAYQNVVDAAENMNTQAMSRAVDYAVYFRQKYEATRIADTEFMRAYGNTRIAEANYDPDVTCLRVRLDSSHRKYDVCDFYANADLYGRGPGVFPKDLFPRYPFHPHCHCGIENIFEIEAPATDKSDFDPAAGKRYLRSLNDNERSALLGVNRKTTNDWQDDVRGYEPQTKQKILIPEGAFYGKGA